MKSWQCYQCSRRHKTEKNILFVICKGCLSEMKKMEDTNGKRVSDKNSK